LWLEVSAVNMFEGIVTTFTDITQSKESYQKLRNAADELTQINGQLEQSNFDLLQFASVASHDLKEPLRKIQTYGNLLKESSEEKLLDKEKVYLEKVVKSSNRMQVLIEDILTLSKLSNSTTPYSPVDLNEIIGNITDDLEVVIKEKKAKIIARDLPVIDGINGQVHQLFQNLVSNAIKFNEKDAPVISIAQKRITAENEKEFNIDPKKYLRIDVEDNGIGFDKKYQEKIFGIFQRLNGSEFEGTGIGLAICKKIVDNHNGFIKADSQPGKGACFSIFMNSA
jgi:two-component system CheB/CheR fusion protein